MNSIAELRSCSRPSAEMNIVRVEIPCGELNRFMYTEVGRDWSWTDRLVWSTEQWREYASQPSIETWVGYVRGTPAGFFELAYKLDQGVRRPSEVGRGSLFRADARLHRSGAGRPPVGGRNTPRMGIGTLSSVGLYLLAGWPACAGQLCSSRYEGVSASKHKQSS